MPQVDPVVRALEDALTANPDSHEVRLHLAQLLLERDEAQQALEHCQQVLTVHPDSVPALRLAARAASASGDRDRALSYGRLADALAPPPAAPPATPAPPAALDATAPRVTADDAPQRSASIGEVYGFDDHEVERPTTRLDDVGGMEQVKERLRVAFLAPMQNPKLRQMYGKSLRGGLLLYGPPGCGKTFVARAVAGELGAQFYAVALSDVLDAYLGSSERNLHQMFETARRHAPCVLFFDEVDALGQRRTNVRSQSMWRGVVAQFLNELDSVGSDNEGVFVLAATNHPWDVDTALRRPGRLDRTLLVLPPDAAARRRILETSLRNRPTEDDMHLDQIAAATDMFSGADIAHLCESAAERALSDSITSGVVRPIAYRDLDVARRELSPSTVAWFQVARNFAMFANDGGMYDDLLEYMRQHRLT